MTKRCVIQLGRDGITDSRLPLALGAVPEPKYREPWGLKTFPIWPDAKVTYVGFEMESSCAGIPFTPPSERENMIVRSSLHDPALFVLLTNFPLDSMYSEKRNFTLIQIEITMHGRTRHTNVLSAKPEYV